MPASDSRADAGKRAESRLNGGATDQLREVREATENHLDVSPGHVDRLSTGRSRHQLGPLNCNMSGVIAEDAESDR